MRARMVRWKSEEIARARQNLDNYARQGAAARAAASLVIQAHPALDHPHTAGQHRAHEPRRHGVGMWRCIDPVRGAYHEVRLSLARDWARGLGEDGARHFLLTSSNWLDGLEGERGHIAEAHEELARAQRELRFFQVQLAELQATASASAADDGSGSGGDGGGERRRGRRTRRRPGAGAR